MPPDFGKQSASWEAMFFASATGIGRTLQWDPAARCCSKGSHSAPVHAKLIIVRALLATPFLPLSQAEPSSRHMTPRYLVKPETLWKVIRQNEDGSEDILAVADTEEEAEETSAYLKEQETDARQQRE